MGEPDNDHTERLSQLRESHARSEGGMPGSNQARPHQADGGRSLWHRLADILRPFSPLNSSTAPDTIGSGEGARDFHVSGDGPRPDERTRLLESFDRRETVCGSGSCTHGTFSPRPVTPGSVAGSVNSSQGTTGASRMGSSGIQYPVGHPDGILDGEDISPTKRLALEHGVHYHKAMYVCRLRLRQRCFILLN